jgi:hypothetical protein
MVPLKGFEPPTHALRMRCSTPELQRRAKPHAECVFLRDFGLFVHILLKKGRDHALFLNTAFF